MLLELQKSLQRPNRQHPQEEVEGVGFTKALAVVRLVCLGWLSRYDVRVRWVRLMQPNLPLALCSPLTMDEVCVCEAHSAAVSCAGLRHTAY